MTKNQREIIKDNLRAFEANFGKVRIENADYGGGFYVYSPADSESYVQYCYSIDYLNGWLYGCVQGAHKCVKFTDERARELKG
mgnify:FL=1